MSARVKMHKWTELGIKKKERKKSNEWKKKLIQALSYKMFIVLIRQVWVHGP